MTARTGLDNVTKNHDQVDLIASQQSDSINTEIDQAVRKVLNEATSSWNWLEPLHSYWPVAGGASNSGISLEENCTRPLNVKWLVEQAFRRQFPSDDTQHNGENGWGFQRREADYNSLMVDEFKLLDQMINKL